VSFIHFEENLLGQNRIRTLYEDSNGIIWVSAWDRGLVKIEPGKKLFTRYEHEQENDNSLSHNSISAILEENGFLWIGTNGHGLDKIDIKSETFTHHYDDSANTTGLHGDIVYSLFQSEDGVIWIGTHGGGIHKYSATTSKFKYYAHIANNSNSLSHPNVTSIYEDRTGVVWVGTFDGLDRLDRTTGTFTHYQNDPNDPFSLSDNHIFPILEDRAGMLWIGTFDGLNKFDREKVRFKRYREIPGDPRSLKGNFILDIYEDRAGTLWVGTRNGGLNKFDHETETFVRYLDRQNPTTHGYISITSIYEDRARMLWLGTENNGLSCFDRKTKNFVYYKHDLQNPNSLIHNNIMMVYEDQSIGFWLASGGGGLSRMTHDDRGNAIFSHYTECGAQLDDVIYSILPDNSGNLWMSTNKGLVKFDPQKNTCENYDVDDGLQSSEFNSGAYHKNSKGEMYFGGINGFNIFHPDSLQTNNTPPPVVVTAVRKYDAVVKPETYLDKALKLSHKDKFVSFEFAALDYTNPKKNQYAYKLEGFDEDWIYCGTRRYTGYTNLDPGDYVFRVKGSNNDDVWNEEGVALAITISPPFWRTPWFVIVSAALLLLSVVLAHKYGVRHKVQQSLQIERVRTQERDRVREQVSRDYHDEMGHKLTKIGLFTELIERKLNGRSPEIQKYIGKVVDAAESLDRDTKDFIWTLNPVKDTFYDLAIYLKEFGDSLFDETEVSLRLKELPEELESMKLPMEWKRHLTYIMKEAMTNILKHADCRKVKLVFRLNNRKLKMTLLDNGSGFDIDKLYPQNGSGNGLRNMRKRAKQIGGEMTIQSNPGKGTRVQFSGKIS